MSRLGLGALTLLLVAAGGIAGCSVRTTETLPGCPDTVRTRDGQSTIAHYVDFVQFGDHQYVTPPWARPIPATGTPAS